MPEEQNYYEEMGVPFDATESKIKEAYKKLAKKYHPDLNPDMPQWAANQMRRLNVMYNTLSDPLRRQDYDRKIGKKQAPATTSYPHGYSSQWNETRHESQTKQKTSQPHKKFRISSVKILRITGIGMLVSGLIAFLILSFLPTKPSRNEPATVSTSRGKGEGALQPSPTASLPLRHEKVDLSKAEVHYKQGIEYIKNGKIDEAVAEFERAIKINPEHFHVHAYLGLIYGAEERFDEAIHEYEKAISINPDFADAYYGLAVIYEKKGMFGRAERELEIYKWLTDGQ
ncbi:MAG: tetratricopeptide repeat protein [Candidatus Brocadiales bacterium]